MRFLADENFNGHIYGALEIRLPAGALARVQDVGLMGADDPAVLAWAGEHNFIVLTHDVQTFIRFANARVSANLGMPGVFHVRQWFPIPRIVDDIEMVFECSAEEEWRDRVVHLPF